MKIKYMGKLDPETNPLPTNKLKEIGRAHV